MALKSVPVPLQPIAAALISLFGIVEHEACAAPAVTNCDDSGDGSLRASVLAASEGDTVDASQLPCSTISLTTGFIAVVQNSLTIIGPGSDKLTIDGSTDPGDYNILFHNGNGTLEIDNLAMTQGYFYLNAAHKYLGGGCLFSFGNVSLNNVRMSYCSMAAGPDSVARGGAVYANGSLNVTNTIITDNRTIGALVGGYYDATFGGALFAKGSITIGHSSIQNSVANYGGGIYAPAATTISDSSISGNSADNGAGIMCRGALSITSSTISGNFGYFVGGIFAAGPTTGSVQPATIRNSTISGNISNFVAVSVSAIASNVPLTVSNSTIAFNKSYSASTSALVAAGASLQLDSSIVAENIPADLYAVPTTTVGGAKNFINNTAVSLAQTISGCPKLDPLADNGGPSKTHALRPGSPAIDAGSNLLLLPHDQRGPGFTRVYDAIPDIGAFEWQGEHGDHIFRNGFNVSAAFCDW
jgi:hypothetical protein